MRRLTTFPLYALYLLVGIALAASAASGAKHEPRQAPTTTAQPGWGVDGVAVYYLNAEGLGHIVYAGATGFTPGRVLAQSWYFTADTGKHAGVPQCTGTNEKIVEDSGEIDQQTIMVSLDPEGVPGTLTSVWREPGSGCLGAPVTLFDGQPAKLSVHVTPDLLG